MNETDSRLKKIYEKLVQSKREKLFGCFGNKSDNCKLLTLSKRLQLNC